VLGAGVLGAVLGAGCWVPRPARINRVPRTARINMTHSCAWHRMTHSRT